jgi:hypothetical protein
MPDTTQTAPLLRGNRSTGGWLRPGRNDGLGAGTGEAYEPGPLWMIETRSSMHMLGALDHRRT